MKQGKKRDVFYVGSNIHRVAPAGQKHQFPIWTLVITKQPFLMQSAKLLYWATEAGLFCLDWRTHRSCIHPDISPLFFTASPTAALKYTARKHFASCFFTESRRCWSPSTRTRCHRPSLSLESHFLIYPRLHVCPWLRAEKLWKGNPSETSGVFLLQHLTAASCSYHCCVCKRFNGWLSAQIIILYVGVWKEQKEAKLVSVGVFFL